MKRDHEEMTHHSILPSAPDAGEGSSSKGKVWEGGDGGGVDDELLAVLGYKVKSSDMADVADKLEQLEMAMCTVQEDGISHLSCDTVHYNPSDINGWLESMLSEFNPLSEQQPTLVSGAAASSITSIHNNNLPVVRDPFLVHLQHQSSNSSFISTCSSSSSSSKHPPPPPPPPIIYEDNSEYDLRAIPGIAVYRSTDPEPDFTTTTTHGHKRLKPEPSLTSSVTESLTPPPSADQSPARLVLVDSQETGVRLVHSLMACAEAVQNENLKLADALVKQIGLLAVSQTGAMRKVATYFAEALARRIYKIYPPQSSIDSSYADVLQMHFYDTCPYLKFAHFTANQAILEAFTGSSVVHVIDFSMKQGMQWPALMQALALRPGGPPSFRLTGIGPPQPDNTDALQQVGLKLAHLAETIGIEFHYQGFVCDSLADLEPTMLDIKLGETVAVNSVFEFHRLLARPGAIEKVLKMVKAMKPKIVTVVEQEANHNGPVFLDRFNESLHYYSTLFDSLEGCGGVQEQSSSQEDVVMTEVYLGRQICNVVACEGIERVERHETLVQWRGRMEMAGFDPVHLGSNAFKQASMLLALNAGGDGYRVEESNGCLMLGWHTRPLIATSAWRIAAA